jgi:hypothetical protein
LRKLWFLYHRQIQQMLPWKHKSRCKNISGAYHHANPYVYSRKCTLNFPIVHMQKYCRKVLYQIANEYFLPLPKWRTPKMVPIIRALIQFNPKIGISAPRKSNSCYKCTSSFYINQTSVLKQYIFNWYAHLTYTR